MSAIITPHFVNGAGVAVFPVDKPTSNYIGAGRRFIISPLPREQAENTPDGVVDLNYSLVANQSLKPFFFKASAYLTRWAVKIRSFIG